ncbi:dihydroorotate dehydrogenase-like protein [Calothrix sp. NIES-3974]|uniref:dihydroorotate dehydrogenase-like protein n=1 Tax=Calothrix sp. NIES-3974 TaxID=2005462 RepID=UPI000B5E18F0|nr:dihydroorotate dehydrogenase-like protein [Calothrix sp. NIES-3974]BAZ07833.1 dihydroorotate dehydrogenase 2 [Calothrix sp. NIES-3974]
MMNYGVDTSVSYMGMTLRSPLVVSASPLSEDISNIMRMEDAGAGAVVLYSLFEEQIPAASKQDNYQAKYNSGQHMFSLAYSPESPTFRTRPDEYIELIRTAKQKVDIPIIASLNCTSLGNWINYARYIEQAGADGLELNIYIVPTDINLTSGEIEQNYLDILQAVKAAVKIPIAVKLNPFLTNVGNLAKKLDLAGADALVLFNRFYLPDINLNKLQVEPNVFLSSPQAKRLPMRWIAILYGQIAANLGATSGIHRGHDAVKLIMVGADVTMLCSTLLLHGIKQIKEIELELCAWMEQHEFSAISQFQGIMSHQNNLNPQTFERVQYIQSLKTFKPEWSLAHDTSYYFG